MSLSLLDLEEDNELSSATFQVAKLGGLPSSILYFPNFPYWWRFLLSLGRDDSTIITLKISISLRWCGKIFFYFRKVNLELILNWVENKKNLSSREMKHLNYYGKIQFGSVELKPTRILTKVPLFPVRFLIHFPRYSCTGSRAPTTGVDIFRSKFFKNFAVLGRPRDQPTLVRGSLAGRLTLIRVPAT